MVMIGVSSQVVLQPQVQVGAHGRWHFKHPTVAELKGTGQPDTVTLMRGAPVWRLENTDRPPAAAELGCRVEIMIPHHGASP